MSTIDTHSPTSQAYSNRLPVLAAEIRCAHADVQEAAKTAAERAIDAGKALLEAKELVNHGEWLPWLRENCALAERTAQLYMQLAKKGVPPETVAALGLSAAANALGVIYCNYDPFAVCNDEDERQWPIYALFLAKVCGWYSEAAWEHMEWILGGVGRQGEQPWKIPGDWLGEQGTRCRERWGVAHPQPSKDFIERWDNFLKENGHLTREDVERELGALYQQRGPMPPPPPTKRRRKRKSASVADLGRAA